MNKKVTRYTRLKDISKFGFDIDWDDLKAKRVIFAGVGGIGSLAAEMLTRCGIGTLDLIDIDTVSVKNLNRLFFGVEDIDKPKVEVAKRKLSNINEEVTINVYHTDICALDFHEEFEDIIDDSDLLMMGLDNIPAREYVNTLCVTNNLTYIDSGASRSGLGGYVHRVIPYKTACYKCPGSIEIGKKMRDVEGEPCSASLPFTIAIIASIQVEQALKTLLPNLGTMPDYITYNGLQGRFYYFKQKMDPKCSVCGKKARKAHAEQEEDIIQIQEIDPELLQMIDDLENSNDHPKHAANEQE